MHSFLLAASFGRSFLNACNHIAKRPGDLDRFRLSRESTGRGLAELLRGLRALGAAVRRQYCSSEQGLPHQICHEDLHLAGSPGRCTLDRRH